MHLNRAWAMQECSWKGWAFEKWTEGRHGYARMGFSTGKVPHPIRPLKIYYIQLLLMLHTYILMGCHLGCLRRPRNLCVLDATWISKFRNPSGIEDTKLRPGPKRKFCIAPP